jgi:hypothetical protein
MLLNHHIYSRVSSQKFWKHHTKSRYYVNKYLSLIEQMQENPCDATLTDKEKWTLLHNYITKNIIIYNNDLELGWKYIAVWLQHSKIIWHEQITSIGRPNKQKPFVISGYSYLENYTKYNKMWLSGSQLIIYRSSKNNPHGAYIEDYYIKIKGLTKEMKSNLKSEDNEYRGNYICQYIILNKSLLEYIDKITVRKFTWGY